MSDINARVEAKRDELLEVFADLPENQLKVAGDLIGQAAFMAVTLEDLAQIIATAGPTEEYRHGGGQTGTKVSSAAKLYGAVVGKYTTIINRLLKLTPKQTRNIEAEREAQRSREREQREQIIAAERAAVERERDRLADAAAFEALRAGEIIQDEFIEYRNRWRDLHTN